MKQKIQAAVFDVDGTLYDYKTHSIPQSTAEAIESLRAQGVRIVIASGRSSALLGKQVIQTVRPYKKYIPHRLRVLRLALKDLPSYKILL